MGIVIELRGTEEARGWLELARDAAVIEDEEALLDLARTAMRKTRLVTTGAGPFFTRAGRLAVQGRRSRAARS